MKMRFKKKPDVLRGVAAGVVGGLAAAWTMNLFLEALSCAKEAAVLDEPRPDQKVEEEDSTEKVGDRIAYALTGRHLGKPEKKKVGPIVHYAFGATMGGVYGTIAEYSPRSRSGWGTLFGTVLFVVADEIVVPALKLGKSPAEDSMSNQVSHLLAHMVYGATVETVRFGIRKLI